jgi:pantoate--beta-alanine ligase
MILLKRSNDLSNYLDSQRKQGKKVNFVPTMGALHPGHLSLITNAKTNDSLCVCSIFVNPTQFNDPADFKKYPVTIENDILLLETAGCDLLFLPSVEEIYPDGTKPTRHYDLGYLETVLEGKYRPGHFQGVCMVVHRLLDLVNPDRLHIGQKDYQQCMVIKTLVHLIGMENTVQVIISPTLREPDGLAMSSRNARLTEHDRKTAVKIFETLQFIRQEIKPGKLDLLKKQAVQRLIESGFKVDYVEIADAETLQIADRWDEKQKLVALAAAFLDEVRLIDNILLS